MAATTRFAASSAAVQRKKPAGTIGAIKRPAVSSAAVPRKKPVGAIAARKRPAASSAAVPRKKPARAIVAGASRRAAFDIGSGATKLVVADVVEGVVVQTLFGQEIPVSFAVAWKQSTDGRLSEEIQAQGLDVLRKLLAVCEKFGVPAFARRAVATEVFRKAVNGGAYLERVCRELGLPVEVVTQTAEASLGFKTAVALSGGPAENVVCWDSGGASFQITSLDPSQDSSATLRSYVGPWGSGNSTALLVEGVQGHSFAQVSSPNPVAPAEAARLIKRLRQELAKAPTWLHSARVTAIGGQNSMFCVVSEALGAATYGLADVRRALESVVGCLDEELASRPYCQGALKEPTALIVPKVCLLLAVMEHCLIEEVRFCAAIGSCPGLLISEDQNWS